MNTWFTADTHYGHANIIKYTPRPFADISDMETQMIARWNTIVQPNDVVYHLGDFVWGKASLAENVLARLHGKKILVAGNHDSKQVRKLPGWETVAPMIELKLDGQLFVLCHYAMLVWNRSHYGTINLHGHSHGSIPTTSQRCDVGVDCWDYRPVSVEQIIERLASATPHAPADYHKNRT